jgi:histidyl-tRNA synthetase
VCVKLSVCVISIFLTPAFVIPPGSPLFPKMSEPDNEIRKAMMESGGGRICCPKGMRDLVPFQMRIRERSMGIIRGVFKKHGSVEIETPAMERREVLLKQYGQDSEKLIYDIKEYGLSGTKEHLCMRYDLTVPLCRYCINHKITNIKRMQISPVWRRDQPQAGRFRQFYQCDFDVIGNYEMPRFIDAECLVIIKEILTDLDIGSFIIKVNNRKILNGLIALAGIPPESFKKTCSVIDELDKISWADAKLKLSERGISPSSILTLEFYVNIRGPPGTVVEKLKRDSNFMAHAEAVEGLSELEQVFNFAQIMGALDVVSFDLSMARGLDYYTGMILEGFLTGGSSAKKQDPEKEKKDKNEDTDDEPGVGAICGGGRYDKLVGDIKQRFAGRGERKPSDDLNAMGFSIGIERIFSILEKKAKQEQDTRESDTTVYVASIGKSPAIIQERLAVAAQLWKAGIATEFSYQQDPKPQTQTQYAMERRIPFIVFIGGDELKGNYVTLRQLDYGKQEEQNEKKKRDAGQKITREDLVPTIRRLIYENRTKSYKVIEKPNEQGGKDVEICFDDTAKGKALAEAFTRALRAPPPSLLCPPKNS